jgi:hypothetical protein
MKKQFLHENHNRQDKTKNPDYLDRIKDEGDDFNRGGKSQERLLSFRGSSVFLNLKLFLADDKESLLRTLERNLKFVIDGESGTVSQLLKLPKVAEDVKERCEMTRRSINRAAEIVDVVKHPKKNSHFRTVEFKCFLQPEEPFQNPIFKKHFAFRANIVNQSKA